MTPVPGNEQEMADRARDTLEVWAQVAGALTIVWAFVRGLFLPLWKGYKAWRARRIGAEIRSALALEIAQIQHAAARAEHALDSLAALADDLEAVEEWVKAGVAIARDNRAWLEETHDLLTQAGYGMPDRRESPDRRADPLVLPPLGESRRRHQRRAEDREQERRAEPRADMRDMHSGSGPRYRGHGSEEG